MRVWGEEGAVAVSVSGRYTPIWFFRPCVWRVCVYMCVCVCIHTLYRMQHYMYMCVYSLMSLPLGPIHNFDIKIDFIVLIYLT